MDFEKQPLIDGARNARQRVVYVIHYGRQYENALFRMLMTLFFIFIFYYIFFVGPLSQRPGGDYTYYLMTKRWPAGECKFNEHCFKDLSKYDKWVIHGLWPEFSNNTWDQFCTKNKFNITAVEDLRAQLTEYWPNLLDGKGAESLWAHEWEKHGTCSPLKEKEYFELTLAFHEQTDLTTWLKNSNIRPSNSHTYTEAQFRDAIKDHIDHRSIQFNCETRKSGRYIKEIYFCLSFKDARTPVPCTVKSTCHGSFFYPSLQQ